MTFGETTRTHRRTDCYEPIDDINVHIVQRSNVPRGKELHTSYFRAACVGVGIGVHVRAGQRLPPFDRRNRVQLPCITATSDERPCVEARKKRVAVHRAQRVVQGCEDEIGRVYDQLPESSMK